MSLLWGDVAVEELPGYVVVGSRYLRNAVTESRGQFGNLEERKRGRWKPLPED
jgi:hypothetical protein